MITGEGKEGGTLTFLPSQMGEPGEGQPGASTLRGMRGGRQI